MIDYSFPLPPESLIKRYQEVFEGFKKGQSCTFISLPLHSRAAWLKFILNNPKFLKKLTGEEKFYFLEIDESKTDCHQLVKLLAIKIGSSGADESLKALSSNQTLNEDSFIIIAQMENILQNLPKDVRFVIILPRSEELFDNYPKTIDVIAKLSKMRRTMPNPLFCFLFGGNPTFLEKRSRLTMSPLWQLLNENVCFNQLLNPNEMLYTKERLEFFTNKSISQRNFETARHISGGHLMLFQTLLTAEENELSKIIDQFKSEKTDPIIESIWAGIPSLAKSNWNAKFIQSYIPLRTFGLTKNDNLQIPLLPPQKLRKEKIGLITTSELTSQEKIIFDFLQSNNDRLVSRDEIAQSIWGKLWQEKYSDWAIDRSISKLRRKLSNSEVKIAALRGRGYRFIST